MSFGTYSVRGLRGPVAYVDWNGPDAPREDGKSEVFAILEIPRDIEAPTPMIAEWLERVVQQTPLVNARGVSRDRICVVAFDGFDCVYVGAK
jgi:hypothetical protein